MNSNPGEKHDARKYDEWLAVLRRSSSSCAYRKARRLSAFGSIDRSAEAKREPVADFDAARAHERAISASIGGRTAFDDEAIHKRWLKRHN
jgi:hypothetical protein